jgi:hypothetical protein
MVPQSPHMPGHALVLTATLALVWTLSEPRPVTGVNVARSFRRPALSSPTTVIYYLAHALVIAVGAALTLLRGPIWTAIGTSLIATGAAGSVIYLYLSRTDRARDAIDTLNRFGLATVYDRRAAQIRNEYAIRLDQARSAIDILGFGLKDFRRDYISTLGALASRAPIRILLIDPFSEFSSMRDREENQTVGTIQSEVLEFIAQFKARYTPTSHPNLSVRLYTSLPLVNIFRIDDEIFWGPYLAGQASGNTITLRVTRGLIFEQLMGHFNELWSNFSKPIDEV